MENKSHAFVAGLFTLLLGAAIILTIVWLKRDTVERVPYEVVTRGSVTGLSPNALVRLRGLPVGRVEKIDFDPRVPGQIVIRIAVDRRAPVTASTVASLGYQGVTGLAYMQLDDNGHDSRPLVAPPGQIARLPMRPSLLGDLQKRGEALLAQSEKLLTNLQALSDQETRQRMLDTAASIQHAADRFGALAEQLRPVVGQLPETVSQLNQTLASTRALTATLNRSDGPLFTNLNRAGLAAERASVSLQNLDRTVAELSGRVGYDTLPRLNSLSDDVRAATRSVTRAADLVGGNPRTLLFGAPPASPGPGEPGFHWPAEAGQ
ncbi:MlaD family protein [Chitinasiproducens palmae]|uniref:Phospholipid/cholesterol/gamma-HCH transport system substrate-binding protein n=1 Tax=Chitinasiproducens palmae TaxID=1770053 RepID=A0A1H2PP16_9BURK|nr:MlaD family protein [Chitinasiproducens palmae]SDV48363.1 phospholipid/cholesterol/gamma-HCH transport system substrate-binding protein [Chitinasiproducens palmae]